MALFELDVPDELLPALVAEFYIVATAGATEAITPEEYFAGSVIETLRQRAELYRVGEYYVGPIPPQFNADGTPYVSPEPEIEEDPLDNDTSGGAE